MDLDYKRDLWAALPSALAVSTERVNVAIRDVLMGGRTARRKATRWIRETMHHWWDFKWTPPLRASLSQIPSLHSPNAPTLMFPCILFAKRYYIFEVYRLINEGFPNIWTCEKVDEMEKVKYFIQPTNLGKVPMIAWHQFTHHVPQSDERVKATK